jgi:non-ribosomal peptide synthetase component E (peptide arylation enzyme)
VTITGRIRTSSSCAENISAAEISVLHLHRIADIAVIGVPDPRTGERVCAVIAPRSPEHPPTLASIAAFCREQGLATQKIPERLEVVDEIPRTGMGKAEKTLLRRRLGS